MSPDHYYRFGIFEARPREGELRRRGMLVRLPPKPFALLAALLERCGQVVTREELERRLWPDTHVEFEHGLNNTINRLRVALGDSAVSPRFVETVPGRGYRFVASVEVIPCRSPSRRTLVPRRRGLLPLAGAVGMVLALGTGDGTRRASSRRVTDSPALASYWTAMSHYNRHDPGSLVEARRHFEEAIAQDPELAPAHAGLAQTMLQLVRWQVTSREELGKRTHQAAARAVALDPNLAEARVALAQVRGWLDWRWATAEQELQLALRLDPQSPSAHRAFAELLAAQGRANEAIQAIDRACELEPLSTRSLALSGRLRYYARRYDEAIERLRVAVAMEPERAALHKALSDAYWQKGLHHEAEVELRTWLEGLGVGWAERQRVSLALAGGGMVGLWRENVARAVSARSEPRGSDSVGASAHGVPFKIATLYAGLGEAEPAVEWLEQALEQRDLQLLYLRLDPSFDRVRDAPGFHDFVARTAQVFRLSAQRPPLPRTDASAGTPGADRAARPRSRAMHSRPPADDRTPGLGVDQRKGFSIRTPEMVRPALRSSVRILEAPPLRAVATIRASQKLS